jgi:PKD repeat protein
MQMMSVLWRPPYFRALGIVILVGSMTACGSSDRLTSVDDSPSGLGASAAQPVQPPSFSTTSLSGIPFGTWALPTVEFGDLYNGAMRNIDPGQLLKELASIKAKGGRVVLMFAGQEDNYKDQDGHFSLSLWKSRVDRFKTVNFGSYIDDGTVIGHYMIDEPNDPVNWHGVPVDGGTLEQMAAYSKQLWPKLPTVVRADPSYMARYKITYQALDAGWAQYAERKGDPAKYIRDQILIAHNLGLGLITGLNIRKGAIGGKNPLTAELMRSAGSALLAEDYPCAFISWEYDVRLLSRPDIKAVMEGLSQKARQHPARSCAGSKGGNPPPPPPPPPPPANQLPVAAFTAPSCTVGVPCSFEDQSTDADGKIAARSWSFGDGETSTDAKPTHTFVSAASLTVTLQVTDDAGGSKSISASVIVTAPANQPPVAAFDTPSCTAGVPCQFTDASTDGDGQISIRSWAFGDGETSSGTNPSHTFAAANGYTVTLTVTDDKGASKSVTLSLTVAAPISANLPPVAAFGSPSCSAGVPCRFSDGSSDSDGNVAIRSWSFPDGTASDASPLTTFASAGTYSVTLTVIDDDGASNSVSHDVVVAPNSLPGTQPIVLGLRMMNAHGQQLVKLSWKGAVGAKVDIYRNGSRRESVINDGTYIRTTGGTLFQYQICETGSARCSNMVSTSVAGPPPPPPPPPPPSPLTLTAKSEMTVKPWVVLTWSGAHGANIDFYRDGTLFKTVPNSGSHINSRGIQLGSTYVFKVCEQNSTTCSGNVTVTVK